MKKWCCLRIVTQYNNEKLLLRCVLDIWSIWCIYLSEKLEMKILENVIYDTLSIMRKKIPMIESNYIFYHKITTQFWSYANFLT